MASNAETSKLLQKKTKRQDKKSAKEQKEQQQQPPQKPIIKETQFYKDEHDLANIEENEQQTNENIPIQITSSNDNKTWINRTRTLVVSSRGVSHQERHLVNNLLSLIPNAKKECKIEKEIAREELTEICYNHSCKYSLYFEHRKRELVLWMFKTPEGPCAKFQVRNIHALNEIRLMGNCIKYSRPFLSFDKSFDELPHLKLLKEMFIHTFGSPKGHPKTKPFYDHVMCFYNVNNHIFFRNYQILNEVKEKFTESDVEDKMNLLEIGPRFSMNLIRIFDGALGGKTIYLNKNYIPPSLLLRRKMDNYKKRKIKETEKKLELNDKLLRAQDKKQQKQPFEL